MRPMDRQVILVTGSTDGLGRQLAHELSDRDHALEIGLARPIGPVQRQPHLPQECHEPRVAAQGIEERIHADVRDQSLPLLDGSLEGHEDRIALAKPQVGHGLVEGLSLGTLLESPEDLSRACAIAAHTVCVRQKRVRADLVIAP